MHSSSRPVRTAAARIVRFMVSPPWVGHVASPAPMGADCMGRPPRMGKRLRPPGDSRAPAVAGVSRRGRAARISPAVLYLPIGMTWSPRRQLCDARGELAGDREALGPLVVAALLGRPAHAVLDRRRHDDARNLVGEEQRLLERQQRDQADQDRDRASLRALRGSGRARRGRRPAGSGRSSRRPRSSRAAWRARPPDPRPPDWPRRRSRTRVGVPIALPARSAPAFKPFAMRSRPSTSTSETCLACG